MNTNKRAFNIIELMIAFIFIGLFAIFCMIKYQEHYKDYYAAQARQAEVDEYQNVLKNTPTLTIEIAGEKISVNLPKAEKGDVGELRKAVEVIQLYNEHTDVKSREYRALVMATKKGLAALDRTTATTTAPAGK